MTRILSPSRNCHGVYDTNGAGVLIDGRNYYRAFFETALTAKRYILIAGWQFERSVPLLRGADAEKAGGEEVIMAPFLNRLCEKNPGLEIFILMWDFSAVVSLDKEWFNKLVLDLTTSDRIRFKFDSSHALYASQHQKLVVIDGAIAFVGGLDICANGWDDRLHWAENAERVVSGEHYEPYHDVQSISSGAVAWELAKLFEKRWIHAGGTELGLTPPEESALPVLRKMLPLPARMAAISTTRAQTLLPLVEPVMHIRQLYLDAVAAAEKLIYMENQYFSSQAVYEALKKRLTDTGRACPEIVIVLPKRLHTLIEDISLSVVQARMLKSLTEIADRFRRSLGIYYSAAALPAEGGEKATYIHSKVLVVDDRFISIGSANISNRSMGMDTELNLSWEADESEKSLIRSIRRIRSNLLAEHTGLRRLSQRRALGRVEGLVQYLNGNVDQEGCRLRRHTLQSFLEDIAWIRDIIPEDISIDPERPIIEEGIYEIISRDRNSIFAKGLLLLNQMALQEKVALLAEGPDMERGGNSPEQTPTPASPGQRRRKPNETGFFRWYVIGAIGIGIAVAVWLIFRQ